jgi:hypothetical protein
VGPLELILSCASAKLCHLRYLLTARSGSFGRFTRHPYILRQDGAAKKLTTLMAHLAAGCIPAEFECGVLVAEWFGSPCSC